MKSDHEWIEKLGTRIDRQRVAASPELLRQFVREIQADALEFAGQTLTLFGASGCEKPFHIIHAKRCKLLKEPPTQKDMIARDAVIQADALLEALTTEPTKD